MDIGCPIRIIDVEPIVVPIPGELPAPAPSEVPDPRVPVPSGAT
jgi:hypothetical protein